MAFAGTSHLAIFAAAIAAWVFGALWYTVLSKPWMKAAALTPELTKGPSGKPSPVPFILSFFAELLMAYILAGLIGHLGPGQVTLKNGIISGAFVWAGFILTTTFTMNAYQKRSYLLSVIDCGHWLGVMLIMGAVIGAMGV